VPAKFAAGKVGGVSATQTTASRPKSSSDQSFAAPPGPARLESKQPNDQRHDSPLPGTPLIAQPQRNQERPEKKSHAGTTLNWLNGKIRAAVPDR